MLNKTKRLSFGYIVDHPKRDLLGAISFAHAVATRGHDTYIIPYYDQAVDVPLLPLDAIVINFARPTNLELVKNYAAANLPVFVMDTEGGTITETGTNTPERLARLLKERGFSEFLAGYFFWGSRLREAFVENSGLPPSKLIVTGCPRFDYLSSRWRKVLSHERRDYVLINTSYPLVNPLFAASEHRERETAVAAGWNSEYLQKLGDDIRIAFHGFQESICKLAKALPQIQFFVRPHPFENPAPYRELLAGLPNVTVDGQGPVLDAIANARCVLHLNCQTAVEAVMLERLPISLEFLNTERMLGHAPLPSRASLHAQSYDHLVDLVARCSVHAENFPFRERYSTHIHQWFHENDGHAGDRMVDYLLDNFVLRTKPISLRRSLCGSRSEPRISQLAQSMTANLIGSLAVSRLRSIIQPIRRNKAIAVKEVSERLKQLADIDRTVVGKVCRARHPLTHLPLASIACIAERNSTAC